MSKEYDYKQRAPTKEWDENYAKIDWKKHRDDSLEESRHSRDRCEQCKLNPCEPLNYFDAIADLGYQIEHTTDELGHLYVATERSLPVTEVYRSIRELWMACRERGEVK